MPIRQAGFDFGPAVTTIMLEPRKLELQHDEPISRMSTHLANLEVSNDTDNLAWLLREEDRLFHVHESTPIKLDHFTTVRKMLKNGKFF